MTVDAVFLSNELVEDADLYPNLEVEAELTEPLDVDAEIVNSVRLSEYEDYTGDYEVDSFGTNVLLTTSLILPTNDKHMLNDVKINSMPTREEYNEAGGVTLYIG